MEQTKLTFHRHRHGRSRGGCGVGSSARKTKSRVPTRRENPRSAFLFLGDYWLLRGRGNRPIIFVFFYIAILRHSADKPKGKDRVCAGYFESGSSEVTQILYLSEDRPIRIWAYSVPGEMHRARLRFVGRQIWRYLSKTQNVNYHRYMNSVNSPRSLVNDWIYNI